MATVLPALNNLIKERLPAAHTGVRKALRWWLIDSRQGLDSCPAIPRKVGGEWMWLHPRFLTEPLDLEPDVQAKFREFIRPGDTVLDIGAYVGTHTVACGKTHGLGWPGVCLRAFAIELRISRVSLPPQCTTCRSLSESGKRSRRRTPAVHLLNDGDSTSNSMTFGESVGAETRTIEVESITVDAFCEAHNALPAFIKIDVEGAESLVLRGAARVLRECRPTIILALHPQWLPTGVTPEDLRRHLDDAGYDLQTLDAKPAVELKLAEYVCRPRVEAERAHFSFSRSEASQPAWGSPALAAVHSEAWHFAHCTGCLPCEVGSRSSHPGLRARLAELHLDDEELCPVLRTSLPTDCFLRCNREP
jgi:hypothetical protein